MKDLEAQWHQVYQACVAARADIERLRGCSAANGGLVHVARLRLERLEVLKARLLEQMQQLEGPESGTMGAITPLSIATGNGVASGS